MCCQPGNRRGLPAPETDQRRRYSIRMQPRWNHARSAAPPNPSSHAQGLEGKEISSPSGRGRKMSLTSPLIDRDLTPTTQVAGQSWWICIQQVIIIVYRGPATVESIDIWL